MSWTQHTILFALVVAVSAAPVCAAERTHQIEAADYFTIAGISSLAVAPDGSEAAWVEQRWCRDEDGRVGEIWRVNLEQGGAERITFNNVDAGGLQYGPDGEWLYYAADDDDGSTQIWRMEPDGENPHMMTRVKDGIELWDLAADGSAIVYTVGVERTEDEWEELRDRYADLEYGHGITTFSEVRFLDLETWRTRTVFDGDRVVRDIDVSADGLTAALVTTPDNEVVHNEGWSRIDVLDLKTGELTKVTEKGWREDHPSPYGWIDAVDLNRAGNALTFTISFDGYPTRLYTAARDDASWRLREMDRPDGVSIVGGSCGWRAGSSNLLCEGDVDAAIHLYSIPSSETTAPASASRITSGDMTISRWTTDVSGETLVVVSGALDAAHDLYRVQADRHAERLTTINPQIDSWILPTIQKVSWNAPDGRQVAGILELPPGWTPEDGPLPTIIEIHGGPTSATRYEMRFWIYGRTLLAAKGYALLSPNYRGSTGYGDDFLTELIGRENDIEVKDILAGADMLVERGIADADRLGVMGWSNGGFLTNALITQSTLFKVASSGAGVLDQVIQWATEDTPGHVVNFMGSRLPWDNPEHFVKASPLYAMHKVTTPTLIHVGGNDPRVPPAHSRGLYRALSIYLGIPTELVVYPGASHSLRTYTHREAKMAWDVAWIEKYLGPGWNPGQEP